MNPDRNKFEPLTGLVDEAGKGMQQESSKPFQRLLERAMQQDQQQDQPPEDPSQLFRPDGSPVPGHWPVFKVGEEVTVKNYVFLVAYIGETTLLLEPVRMAP